MYASRPASHLNDWKSDVLYFQHDVVDYNGCIWVALGRIEKGGAAPGSNSAWKCVHEAVPTHHIISCHFNPWLDLTVGTEANLPSGTYAMRINGNITAAANAVSDILLFYMDKTYWPNIKLVEASGWWTNGGTRRFYIAQDVWSTTATNPTVADYRSCIYADETSTTFTFRMQTICKDARTNAPYDVWVRYTKNP